MSEQTNPQPTNAGESRSNKSEASIADTVNRAVAPPYEGVLDKAFDKLTSQVLIFLLAYVILLIGVAVFGAGLDPRLLALFYVIPIMGVFAYIWLQRRRYIAEDEEARDVDVGAGVTRSGSTVVGESGEISNRSGRTRVRSGYASGISTVAGRMMPNVGTEDQKISEDFIETYRQLDLENRVELLSLAQGMLKKQRSPDA